MPVETNKRTTVKVKKTGNERPAWMTLEETFALKEKRCRIRNKEWEYIQSLEGPTEAPPSHAGMHKKG
jgi:hypothetical protein